MSTLILTVDSTEPDRLFASTVRAMRRGLDLTVAQLAKASGLARRSIEAIEAGGVTTPAERHHITVALGWLSANQVTKALPVTAPRGDAARAPGAAVDQTPPRRKLKVPGSAGQWAGRVVAHGVVQ